MKSPAIKFGVGGLLLAILSGCTTGAYRPPIPDHGPLVCDRGNGTGSRLPTVSCRPRTHGGDLPEPTELPTSRELT